MYHSHSGGRTCTPALAVAAALVVAAIHLPFVLLHGPFQDGWLHATLFERGEYGSVFQRLLENGRPVAGWVNLASMSVLNHAHGAVWVSLAALTAAAFAWTMAWQRTGLFTPRLCLVLAVVSSCVPANQIIVSIPTVIFLAAHAFFAAGLWMFLEVQRLRGPARTAAATLCAICSVLTATLGEATAVLLLLYPLWAMAGQPTGTWRAGLNQLLRGSWPFALGIAAFVAMFLLFPPIGQGFIQERRITFHPISIALSGASFALTVMVVYLPVWVLLALLWRHQTAAARDTRDLLAMSLIAAGLALGPYIVAARLASPIGWGLRYLYYFGPAVAWLLAAAVPWHDASGRKAISRRWMAGALIAIASVLLLRWPVFYVREAYEDALAGALAQAPAAQTADVMVMDDRTWLAVAPVRDIEWTAFVQRTMSKPGAVVAISLPIAPETAFQEAWLGLRRLLGWAPSQVPTLDATFIRQQVRSMESVQGFALIPEGSCKVVRVTVDPPAAWRDWLGARMAQRLRVEMMESVTPCR